MSARTLKQLLYQMLKVRAIEERIALLYPEGQMRCPVHLCIGQEAISAGVCAHLTHKDLVLSNHRGHGHYIAKGGNVTALFAELYGKSTGCSKGHGGSMHLIDLSVNFLGSTPIVGSILPIATGVAWAEKMHKKNTVTVVFIGDAAVEEGVFHESVNFAVLKNLPIIYVCENNLYSVYTHIRERQPQRPIHMLAAGHGIKTLTGNGNDVLHVYELMRKAQRFISQKRGPVFLELTTYRWREHCGPNFDNRIGYRSQKEFQAWKKKDPIEYFVRFLIRTHFLTNQELKSMRQTIERELDNILAHVYKKLPQPTKQVSVVDVYAP